MIKVQKNWKKGEFGTRYMRVPYAQFEADGKTYRYVDGKNRTSRYRVLSLFEKEPTTIAWMDSFDPQDVFVDIGANVGMYSIYAAVTRGVKVFSFEPESQNYAELNKNIFVNGLHGQVMAYDLAIADRDEVSQLYLGHFAAGLSHHDFGENLWIKERPQGLFKTKPHERLVQGCVSFSLDSLIKKGAVPPPQHIKVDVDGLEWRVFDGMAETLKSPTLKTVLFEIGFDLPRSMAILDKMLAAGWKYSRDQVRLNQHQISSYDQFEQRMKNKEGGQNFIFFKDPSMNEVFARFAATYVPPNPTLKTRKEKWMKKWQWTRRQAQSGLWM